RTQRAGHHGADHRAQPAGAVGARAAHVHHGPGQGLVRRHAGTCPGGRARPRSLYGRHRMKKILESENVSAGYGDTPIVRGLDVFVSEQEIVAIAGTDGAGKSTLIKAVMGLLVRVTGGLVLDGRSLRELPVERRIFHGIGYEPQVSNVFGTL